MCRDVKLKRPGSVYSVEKTEHDRGRRSLNWLDTCLWAPHGQSMSGRLKVPCSPFRKRRELHDQRYNKTATTITNSSFTENSAKIEGRRTPFIRHRTLRRSLNHFSASGAEPIKSTLNSTKTEKKRKTEKQMQQYQKK